MENKETKKAYQERFDAQLKEWDAKLDVLRAKAERASAEAKIEYNQQIARLQDKRDELQTKLQKLRNASDEAWKEMRTGIEHAWTDLQQSFKNAASKFD